MANSRNHWDEVKLQFDLLPYPNLPLNDLPGEPNFLAEHNMIIPYYRRQHIVTDTRNKWILDAGCGSGYKLLALAIANPGSNLVGIDFSQKSIDLAKKRLEYHGIAHNVEFHCISLEDLPSLQYSFDYINCDDVLYLLEDPKIGLKAMRTVLKPDGIIRVNMHSSLQRSIFYRVQEFFKSLGHLRGEPTPEEINITRETMDALENWVIAKREIWSKNPKLKTDDSELLMNLLFRGDRGVTMHEFARMLSDSNLEFISMVNWRQWNLEILFENIEELPISVALNLAQLSHEDQIHMFELLHPVHRLLDLYCGHPGIGVFRPPVEEWNDRQWENTIVHLHPQLRNSAFAKTLKNGAEQLGMVIFKEHLKVDEQTFSADSSLASCLYPLIVESQSVPQLLKRWLKVRPLDIITLEPINPYKAFIAIRDFLSVLENAGYVFLEWDQNNR